MLYRDVRILLGTLSTFSFALLAIAQDSVHRPDRLAIPLDFEVNQQSMGEITIEADPAMQSVAIDSAALQTILSAFDSPQLEERIKDLPMGYVSLSELQSRGFDIQLDLERLVITLNLAVERKIDQSNRQYIRLGYQESVKPNDRHTPEAGISGYANFNARITRSKNERAQISNSQILGIDHAINFGGFALEGDSVWNSKNRQNESAFQLNRIRLVKDLPHRLQRISFGDISTPIKDPQRGFQLWGASFVKEFDIQPYRTFTPTSSASFQLDEKAVVQMQMNGRPVKSLTLDPGLYDIEQFKLAAGLNTMDLEIVTESGSIERIQVNNYGEPTLLNKGISTYALSFGLPHATANEDSYDLFRFSSYQRTLSKTPLISGYYQKGLTEQITANANLQANQHWSRIGTQVTWVNELGSFNANVGINTFHKSGPSDYRLKFDWRREFKGYKLLASGFHATEGFSKISANSLPSSISIQNNVSLRVARRIGQHTSIDLGLLLQENHQGEREQTTNMNIGYKFPNFHSGLSIRHSNRSSEPGLSTYLTITWNPRERWRTRSRIGKTSGEYDNSVTTNIDYSNRGLKNSINANLNVQSNNSGKEIDGRIRLESERYSATISRAHLYQNLNDYSNKGVETSLNSEFAIAFADGAIGFTRRVSESFAIIAHHNAWKDVELGINPTLGGFELKSGSSLFRPVLSDLRAYRQSQTTIRPIAGDAFLETEDFFFLPSYKRGSKLTIGSEFVYSLRSSLLFWNEQPAAYKTINIVGEDMPNILSFTNRSGKFVVTGLKPGKYTITVNGIEDTAHFSISGNSKLEFIEKILLSDPKE